jgi:hypothetical protein
MKIGIELYRNEEEIRQGIQLDVACVIMRLFQTFPRIQFEEEYFQKHIERIKTLSSITAQECSPALRIAMGDAEERGPGYRFLVDSAEGQPLRGSVSRYEFFFLFDETVDEALRVEAKRLIDSFEIKRVINET